MINQGLIAARRKRSPAEEREPPVQEAELSLGVRAEEALACVRSSREELAESNRIKTEVLRMAAHDLRSPLSELSGLIHLIQDEEAVHTRF